jgi:hypothetical protein
MNIDNLKIQYPLDSKTEEYFFSTLSTMKDVLKNVVEKHMKMELPDKSVSELCQIFFYIAINIEPMLEPKYKPGIDLINKNFPTQLSTFQDGLQNIAINSINRGVPQDYILEYLSMYFESSYRKIFIHQPLIL